MICTVARTRPSSTSKSTRSADWSTGVRAQKKPPQAAAGSGTSAANAVRASEMIKVLKVRKMIKDLLEWPFSADARHDARLLRELVQSLSDNGKETLDMSFFSGDSTFTSCLEQVQEVVAAEDLGHRQWACDVIAAHVLADTVQFDS